MDPGRGKRIEETLAALRRGAVIVDLTGNDASANPSATRRQTMAPGARRTAARHRSAREALEKPPVIALTDDDATANPAATRRQTMAPGALRSAARHRSAREALKEPPESALTDNDSPRWEHLAVYPTFLTLALNDGHFTNDNGGLDIHSITEIVLKPSNGYPVSFHLSRDSQVTVAAVSLI
ncbi:hypothetical protein N0V88_007361 [Collariella sp. IMI 366227]|nr:hypothetical protein N0V88_007361 [Collariella sp. IMI 366227]